SSISSIAALHESGYGPGLTVCHVRFQGECRRVSGRSLDAKKTTRMPSRPREFHPEPLTDPDVILSHHPARAIARRLPPSAEIAGSSRLTQLARAQRQWPTPFAPWALPHFVATTRRSAPLRRIGTFSLTVGAACAFSLGIAGQVLTFRTGA